MSHRLDNAPRDRTANHGSTGMMTCNYSKLIRKDEPLYEMPRAIPGSPHHTRGKACDGDHEGLRLDLPPSSKSEASSVVSISPSSPPSSFTHRGARRPRSSTFPRDSSSVTRTDSRKRRSKRSEDERIDYLRKDPYVAQFGPYQARCSLCDRWIRLRPNSTYCSIPWDAHRRTCLKRRIAIEEAQRAFFGDKDIPRPLQTTRIVEVQEHNQPSARPSQVREDDEPSESVSLPPLNFSSRREGSTLPSLGAILNVGTPRVSSLGPYRNQHQPVGTRRLDAERRRETLQADSLIGKVEAHRAFCLLCQRWVQLRRDSSYCLYPWVQHRANCVRKRERHDVGDASCDPQSSMTLSELSDSSSATARTEPESEYEVDSGCDMTVNAVPSPSNENFVTAVISRQRVRPRAEQSFMISQMHSAGQRAWSENVSPSQIPKARAPSEHYYSRGLVDLDSEEGRAGFIYRSALYLLTHTFAEEDDLTIHALVVYLNASMPTDKHEDFDVREVRISLQAQPNLMVQGYRVSFSGN